MEVKKVLLITDQEVPSVEENVPRTEDILQQLPLGQFWSPGIAQKRRLLAHRGHQEPWLAWKNSGVRSGLPNVTRTSRPHPPHLRGQVQTLSASFIPTHVQTWRCGHTMPLGIPNRLPCHDIIPNQGEGEDVLGEGRATLGHQLQGPPFSLSPSCPRGRSCSSCLSPCKARKRAPPPPAVPCS